MWRSVGWHVVVIVGIRSGSGQCHGRPPTAMPLPGASHMAPITALHQTEYERVRVKGDFLFVVVRRPRCGAWQSITARTATRRLRDARTGWQLRDTTTRADARIPSHQQGRGPVSRHHQHRHHTHASCNPHHNKTGAGVPSFAWPAAAVAVADSPAGAAGGLVTVRLPTRAAFAW